MSTVPAVLTAWAALATAAAPALQVGQGTLLNSENDLLIVGYDDGNSPAVSGMRGDVSMSGVGDLETYEVANLLSVWVGDADAVAARMKLFAYLDALDSALDASQNLGLAVVLRARIRDWAFSQPITGEGATADLAFSLQVTGYRA